MATMAQFISEARSHILWADMYHTTGTKKTAKCILCRKKIPPSKATLTHTTNGCNSTVCEACFGNFQIRERDANRAFACPHCELTYKLRPTFGPPMPPQMIMDQNLQYTNWMLKKITVYNNDLRLNKARLPGDADYVDDDLMRRNRRGIWDLAAALQTAIMAHNEQMDREEGKGCIYSRCPQSWFGLPPEALKDVEETELERLSEETTPYMILSKNSMDILEDCPEWLIEEQIERGVRLYHDWLCEYDYAVETAREKGSPLSWNDDEGEHDEYYSTFEWADNIEGFVDSKLEGRRLTGSRHRAEWFTMESSIRAVISREIVNEFLIKDYVGWDMPNRASEQTQRMAGAA